MADEQANGAEPQKLELDIYGLVFRLRAPAHEHDRLIRTAKYVDSMMKEQATGVIASDTTRLAIQTAFLIAKNYFSAMDAAADQGLSGGTEVTTRVDDLVQRLDATLAALEAGPEPAQNHENPETAEAAGRHPWAQDAENQVTGQESFFRSSEEKSQ